MTEATVIALDPKFIPLIKSGEKTGTTRPKRRDYQLGDAILDAEGEIMDIEITGVTYKKLKNITKEELLNDGFETLEDLMEKALLIYYPDLTIEDEVTIVSFEYKEAAAA